MAFVNLASFRDPIDAELAKVKLESADIRAEIADQNLVAVYWLYSRAIGGVKVRVDEADLERAREVLRDDRSDDLLTVPKARGDQEDDERCPHCGSRQTRGSHLQRNVAAFALATGLPIFAWRRRLVCIRCGRSWRRRSTFASDVPAETLEAEQQVYERRDYFEVQIVIAALLALAVLYCAIRGAL